MCRLFDVWQLRFDVLAMLHSKCLLKNKIKTTVVIRRKLKKNRAYFQDFTDYVIYVKNPTSRFFIFKMILTSISIVFVI